jgi:hypothetical protein
MRRSALEALLPQLGLVPEGFWLEVTARASRKGAGSCARPVVCGL